MQNYLQELSDCLEDLIASGYESVPSVLARVVEIADRPPLQILLQSHLPDVDLKEWWERARVESKGMAGRARLEWPTDRVARVALQLAVCRLIAAHELDFLDFTYLFIGFQGNFDDRVRWFAGVVVKPLVRDVSRVAELRVTPPIVENLFKHLSSSGDAQLDQLILESRDKFQDRNPQERKVGLDKLWDSWERLKTLEGERKKTSISRLLDSAASAPEFRALLAREAEELTRIGNTFQIRHWELGTVPVSEVQQVDYLFHRLFALVWLILSTRAANKD